MTTKAERDHLDQVAGLPCACCGAHGVQVHHLREGQGMSQRAEHSAERKARPQWFERRFIESSTGVRFECKICARPMWFPLSKAGKYKTCGSDCAKKLRLIEKEARSKECATCGKVFTPRLSQIRNGVGLYCSQACNTKAHSAMNSKESQAKARKSWNKTYAIRPFHAFGEKNHRWSGGPLAKKQRDKRNGWPSQAARRAKTSKQLPSGTIEQIGACQKWRCVICKTAITKKYHADHIKPLALGGKHEKQNIQLLCPRCNLKKSKKDPIEYMQSVGFLL